MKKTANDKGGAKGKKLQLKKETMRDLDTLKGKVAAVKGGRAAACKCGTSYTD